MGKLAEKYKLGSLETMKDQHDPRNYQFAALRTDTPPASFMDAANYLSSIGAFDDDQQYGDCTSWGGKRPKDWSEQGIMSNQFLYHYIKTISGLWDDEGDYPINAQKALLKYGICEKKYMPKDSARTWLRYAKEEPSEEAKKNALVHRSRTFWEVRRDTLEEYKRAMGVFQTPVNISMMVYASYFDCPADGHLPLPSGSCEGGHSLAAIGYETAVVDVFSGRIWLGNSWGKDWGLSGRAWIPFEEFDAHNITSCFVNLDLDKNMTYAMCKETGEQFLLEERLLIGLNIADNEERACLVDKGMKEEPLEITQSELEKYTLYPLIRKARLGDLFGFNS